MLSTSPNTSSMSTRFELSDCKDRIPRRWSLRRGRHSHDIDQVCWTSTASSENRWRKGGKLPLKCLHWSPFVTGSQGADNTSSIGLIASPPEYGCLAPDILAVSNTGVQQASIQNAECSHEEPNQVLFFISYSSLHHGLPSVYAALRQDSLTDTYAYICNQLWRLTEEGSLRNEHTGLCATVVEGGERIWVAKHPSGLN